MENCCKEKKRDLDRPTETAASQKRRILQGKYFGRLTNIVRTMFLLFLLSILSCIPVWAEETEKTEDTGLCKDVKILYTSDVHCAVDQGWGYGGICAIRQNLAKDYHVLLVDDGDAIQGEPIGLMTKGEAIIDIMNAAGYDIAIPGNHEFDYGTENFLGLVRKAEFPYISCNFRKEGELVFPAYVIREFDGVRIGFVGVTTPMTIRDSAPKYFMDDMGNYIYDFCQDETGEALYQAVQDAVDGARGEGAEYVVVMAHLGNEAEVSPWTYADVISHTSGIDTWLDGHSHDAEQVVMKNKDGQPVYRSACGTKNANIGVLTISVDGTISTELLSWSADISAPGLLGLDNPATEKVAEAAAILDERMNEEIARTVSDLVINEPGVKMRDGKPVRLIQNTETNLGDLCADAYLNHFEDADVAIVNGSGIREGIGSGPITMNDIMKTLPYGTKLDLVKVTGQQLLDILEWSVHSMPEEFGGFEHVAGLTYEVSPDIPTPCLEDEEKMFIGMDETLPRRVSNVRVGDEEIDPDAEYKLVTNDYILVEGDGFTMFRDEDVLQESDAADSEVLLEYLSDTLGGFVGEEYADPYGQGRMAEAAAAHEA